MNYRYLFPGMLDYPPGLASVWREPQLPVLTVAGNTGLPGLPSLCLLTSSEVPPDLILPSFDLAWRLREHGLPVAGGFQGEVEAICLRVLMNGTGPLLVCPARALDGITLSARDRERMDGGQLAYLSCERPACRRATTQVAMRRNDMLLGLADRVVVLSAPPGSRVLRSCAGFLERGGAVACFDHRWNRDLLLLGAFPIPPDSRALRPASLRRFDRCRQESDALEEFLRGSGGWAGKQGTGSSDDALGPPEPPVGQGTIATRRLVAPVSRASPASR